MEEFVVNILMSPVLPMVKSGEKSGGSFAFCSDSGFLSTGIHCTLYTAWYSTSPCCKGGSIFIFNSIIFVTRVPVRHVVELLLGELLGYGELQVWRTAGVWRTGVWRTAGMENRWYGELWRAADEAKDESEPKANVSGSADLKRLANRVSYIWFELSDRGASIAVSNSSI
jgi:hypothetical protein